MSFLDEFLPIRRLVVDGRKQPYEPELAFGSGLTATRDAAAGRITLALSLAAELISVLEDLTEPQLEALAALPTFDTDPTPDTAALRGPSGELEATTHWATDGTRTATLAATSTGVGVVGDGSVPTVLQADGEVALVYAEDTRLALVGSDDIVLQQWVAGDPGEWVTRAMLKLTSTGLVIAANAIHLQADDSAGVDVSSRDEAPTAAPDEGAARLGVQGTTLYVLDYSGQLVALNRGRTVRASSGTVTLTVDGVHFVSGTATVSAVPEAVAALVGLSLTVVNDKTTALTLPRSGTDTIEGETSYDVAADGGKVVLYCEAVGLWRVFG